MNKTIWLKIMVFVVSGMLAMPAFAAKNVLYIFDASGSMWAQMGGRTKIEIAKDVFSGQIPSLAGSDINAGLIVYGHRRKGDCGDIEQLVELKPLNERELITKIQSIQAKGKTPIAASVKLATDKLRVLEEETTILLISDGKESCDPDPCLAVENLKRAGINFVLHVIGFDVNQEERQQLQCLAKAGGGTYVGAENAEELTSALKTVVKPEPPKLIVKVQENIEIIVDGSAAMAEAFDGKTKLEAAVESVNEVLNLQVPDRDNLALRVFGGACSGNNTTLLVKFAQNNVDEIQQQLERIKPLEQTTLADAVIAAADDFSDPQRFSEVSRRVVVVTGSFDACKAQAAEIIYQALKRRNIKPDFYFIGMDLPADKQDKLKRLAGATEGWIYHTKTRPELTRVLKRIIEVEPVIGNINRLSETLNKVTGEFNQMHQAVQQKDYATAEEALARASHEVEGSELPFQDLGKRQDRQDFKTLYQLAKANRDLQHETLGLARNLIDQAKAENLEGVNSSIQDINSVTERFNSNINKINVIIQSF